jgi:hypothetical protein
MSARRLLRLAIPAAILLAAACGGNRVIINLDMDSFMPLEDRSFAYELPGVAPGEVFEDQSPIDALQTPEGLNDALDFEAMTVALSLALDDATVMGGDVTMDVSIRVYLAADDDPALFWQPDNLLVELAGLHTSGTTSVLEDVVDVGDFLELMQDNQEIYMGVWLRVEQQSGLGLVQGDAVVTRLHLHLEGREDVF